MVGEQQGKEALELQVGGVVGGGWRMTLCCTDVWGGGGDEAEAGGGLKGEGGAEGEREQERERRRAGERELRQVRGLILVSA